MAIDAPIVVYDNKKEHKKGEFKKPKASKILQSELEWRMKNSNKESEDSPITVNFNEFKVE